MKNLLRVLLFGFFAGVVVGHWLTKRRQQPKDPFAAYKNDPEANHLREEYRRLVKADEWLEAYEEGEFDD